MSRIVDRTWVLKARTARIHVTTRHPQLGTMRRGAITHEPSTGLLSVWRVTDMDGVDLGTVAGDYLDAEAVLLDATAALDELVPADEQSGFCDAPFAHDLCTHD